MTRILLLIIVVISVSFRLHDLKHLPNGLYWDEQDSTYQAYSLLTTGRDYFANPLPLFPHSFADYRTPVNIYLTVPLVKIFGLTYLPSRLTATILGLLTIPVVYLLARSVFKHSLSALVSMMFIALSPWHFIFSRYNGEITAMILFILLGLLLFFQKKLLLSVLFFTLSVASYSPAKLFVPFLVILIAYQLKNIRYLITFTLLSMPLIFSSLFGVGGSRFHDLAIFTDPQLSATVNYQRSLRLLSRDPNPLPGSRPSLTDQIFVNKPLLLAQTFLTNYLQNFSLDFLTISGDRNLRHSVGLGQLYMLDLVLIILGLARLKTHKWLILLMLALAPVSAALTRDGAGHAGRSILLLVPLILIVGQSGVSRIFIPVYLVFSLYFFQYYFSYYRLTSARYFDYGYSQAVNLALENTGQYSQVWLDFANDPALMSYLFYAQYPPRQFQQHLPLKSIDLGQGISAYQFGSIYSLLPGERNYTVQTPPPGTLVIAKTQKQPAVINYPDSSPQFQTFTF